MEKPLNQNEKDFIDLVRGFDFLRHLGYGGKSFIVYGPEPGINIEHYSLKRGVSIHYSRIVDVGIYIPPMPFPDNSRRFYYVRNICRHFEPDAVGPPETIEANVLFLQQHLLPVLKGEVWIDTLIGRPRRFWFW